VQNAAQAMNESGQVLITSQLRAQSRNANGAGAGGAGADIVELSVHDTGPGISPKVLQNLFVPFVTTKQSGTGLGLAISQRIIQNAGGRVEVQSHSGAGSTFTIVLPATKEKMLDQGALPAALVIE
jgi:two-component system, NtrC family, sensor histidine kinase HydH